MEKLFLGKGYTKESMEQIPKLFKQNETLAKINPKCFRFWR
jgi:hypothetical protein